jgi:FkbM family methyltransferase
MTAIFEPDCEADLKEAFFAHACSGYFVEVGANHPDHLSQTRHLERRGWDGVLVEPQPELAAALRRQRRAKVYGVARVAPQQAGRTMWLHLAGIHSSLDPYLNMSTICPQGTIEVAVTTLDEILLNAGAPAPVDPLSVDLEGLEIDVSIAPRGRLEFVRKHDLGLPFRHLREASRRVCHGTSLPRGKADPLP